MGEGSRDIDGEFLTFLNTMEASLQYPCIPSSGLTRLFTRGPASKPIAFSKNTESRVILLREGVGVMKVKYKTKFRAFRLSGAVGDAPVVIFVTGTVI